MCTNREEVLFLLEGGDARLLHSGAATAVVEGGGAVGIALPLDAGPEVLGG